MDNLLVPGTEDIIYKNDKQKNELYYAFAKHREILLEIPIIKKNIKDFEVIRENSETVLHEVEKLDVAQKELQNNKHKIARLAKTFSAFKAGSDKEIIELNNKILNLEEKNKELKWKKDSYDVFANKLIYKKELKDFGEISQSYKQHQKILETKEQVYKEISSLFLHNKLREAEINIVKYKQRLENIDKSEPELQSKLQKAKPGLLTAWKTKKDKLIDKEKNFKRILRELKNMEKDTNAKIKKLTSERDNSIEVKGKIKNWLEQYEHKTNKLKKDGSLEYVLDPVTGIKKLKDELDHLRNNKLNFESRINEIDNQKEDILKKKEKLNIIKSNLLSEAAVLKNQIIKFDTEEEKIRGSLATNEKYIKDIFQRKDELLNWINNKFNKARDNRAKLQAEIANMEEIWALIQERDYYVPHHVLLKIKDQLEKNSIYCVTGSEWLAAQDINEDQKESYIEYQPLLPYSVIIESNQVKSVQRVIKQSKKLSQDFPIIFIIKNNIKMSSDKVQTDFLEVTQGNFYLYKPDDLDLYISKSKFTQYKNSIEEKLKIKKEDNVKLIEIEHIMSSLKHQMDTFYNEYQKSTVTTWNNNVQDINSKISEIDSEVTELDKNMRSTKKEQDEQRTKLNELLKVIKKQEDIFGRIKEYEELYKMYAEKKEQSNTVIEKVSSLTNEIKKANESKENNKGEQRKTASLIEDFSSKFNEHQEDFEKYNLDTVIEGDTGSENYINLKQEVDTILSDLEDKQSDRSTIEELLNNYTISYTEKKEEINELKIGWDWILENDRPIKKSEVKACKNGYLEQKNHLDNYKKQLNNAEKEVDKANASYKALANQILKHHEKSYYDGFNKEQHKEEIQLINNQLKSIQIEENELNKEIINMTQWKQKNENALKTIENTVKNELEEYIDKVAVLTQEEWSLYDNDPEALVYNMIDILADLEKQIITQERKVDRIFNQYLNQLKQKDNSKLDQFAREVKNIMDNRKLYNYDFVETQFIRIFEGLEYYQKQYEKTLTESDENINHLTNLCLRRARLIYESIIEIPGNSRVNVFDRQLQIIKMTWTITKEGEGKKKIYEYLNQVLSFLQKWKQQGKSEDEINRYMEEMLSSRNLINVIAPIDDCQITVYKPRKESIIKYHRLEYSRWEEVSLWSGGEEYSIYMIMFIIFVTHIREQLEGRPNIWKTIMADNPFGRASSPHILEPVFQVAKSNNVQLLCFTAHRQESILTQFPVVYSLQLRSAYGQEIMVAEQSKAESIESGYYNLNE